jgi:ATP-dependent protease Clp ATPase subunit
MTTDEGKTEKSAKRHCSFCHKDEDSVAILIAAPPAFICDECTHLASIIIIDWFRNKARRAEDDAADIETGRNLTRDSAPVPAAVPVL